MSVKSFSPFAAFILEMKQGFCHYFPNQWLQLCLDLEKIQAPYCVLLYHLIDTSHMEWKSVINFVQIIFKDTLQRERKACSDRFHFRLE